MSEIITIPRGTDYTIPVTLSTGGVAYNLTGATIFFTAKKYKDAAADDSLAVITKDVTSHTDPVNGISEIILTSTQTDVAEGEYECDVRIKTSTGKVHNTTPKVLKIGRAVTRRTS